MNVSSEGVLVLQSHKFYSLVVTVTSKFVCNFFNLSTGAEKYVGLIVNLDMASETHNTELK